jgi:hypothetical protein
VNRFTVNITSAGRRLRAVNAAPLLGVDPQLRLHALAEDLVRQQVAHVDEPMRRVDLRGILVWNNLPRRLTEGLE